jgi:probable F420-dependent oxidoreductase
VKRIMVGVSLGGSFPQGVPSPRILLESARQAEALGYDAVWSGDHVMMYSPIVECVTLLSAMAAVTERIRLGTAVYLLPLRHPTVAAKMFGGLDYLSGGRLIFGVGVGGEFPKEFEACGVPVGERGRRTDEGLEIVRRLWSEPRVSFEGKYYRFTDVALLPRPVQQPHPPIWIGGRSDAALARVARFGDGWLAYMVIVQRFRESMTKIAELAQSQGRDPATISGGLLLFAYVGNSREEAKKMVVADLSARYNQPFEKLVDRYCAFGTPAQCAEAITGFLEAGVRNLAIKFTCPPEEQLDQQAAFAQGVLSLLPS